MITFAALLTRSGYGVMVAAPDLGSGDESRGGSSPPIRTGQTPSHPVPKKKERFFPDFCFLLSQNLYFCVCCCMVCAFRKPTACGEPNTPENSRCFVRLGKVCLEPTLLGFSVLSFPLGGYPLEAGNGREPGKNFPGKKAAPSQKDRTDAKKLPNRESRRESLNN